jgi:hypothetical protein
VTDKELAEAVALLRCGEYPPDDGIADAIVDAIDLIDSIRQFLFPDA